MIGLVGQLAVRRPQVAFPRRLPTIVHLWWFGRHLRIAYANKWYLYSLNATNQHLPISGVFCFHKIRTPLSESKHMTASHGICKCANNNDWNTIVHWHLRRVSLRIPEKQSVFEVLYPTSVWMQARKKHAVTALMQASGIAISYTDVERAWVTQRFMKDSLHSCRIGCGSGTTWTIGCVVMGVMSFIHTYKCDIKRSDNFIN